MILEGEEVETNPQVSYNVENLVNAKALARMKSDILKNRKVILERGFNVKN
ncbi:hypothetical protein Scep_009826 [Stephania cephalantha]|uniref:Uncharacterized protein n=1 Tax=Stephania cephalantha TaxID=152367 RepID=A0AAP0JW58_9MAGN